MHIYICIYIYIYMHSANGGVTVASEMSRKEVIAKMGAGGGGGGVMREKVYNLV